MNDDTGQIENPPANEGSADAARSPELECRVAPTFEQLVADAQRDWSRFLDAQLYVLAATIELLRFAEAHKKEFRDYCCNVFREINSPRKVIDPARASLESLVFVAAILKDPAARRLKRDQRDEYANGLGWFAHMCRESDAEKAVELARSLGGLTGIAALYRKHKDEKDPSRQRRVAKSRATRSAQLIGHDGSATPPESAVASSLANERASPSEMASSARDETIRAPAAAAELGNIAASPLDLKKVAADELTAQETTEKVELPRAATEAARFARAAFDEPQFAQVLVNHLRSQGIVPSITLPPAPANQQVQLWLLANGMYFGPVRDPSVCAMVAAQLVAQHRQRRDVHHWRL